MNGYLYILKSKKNNKYYIGSTTDVKRRVEQHNNGQSTYTKHMRPWVVKYVKEFDTIAEARKEETRLKKIKRREYIEELFERA